MSLFTFRVSKTEAAVAVVYVALVLAYLEYLATDRQARAQRRTANHLSGVEAEVARLNNHIAEYRDQDPDDDFELSDTGCPCA